MRERVLNEDGQFEPCYGDKDHGKTIAELLTLEKGKSATLSLELRELKKKCDALELMNMKLVEKYDKKATKALKDAEKTDPVKKK